MPEAGPLRGVYRRPFHRDPLVYVALLVGVGILVRSLFRESSTWGQVLGVVTAFPAGFAIVGVVGGFFRDPPP